MQGGFQPQPLQQGFHPQQAVDMIGGGMPPPGQAHVPPPGMAQADPLGGMLYTGVASGALQSAY
eukprot:scaffold529496_cov54-Prasinocladus_malaysianus.AAC.1